MNEVNLRWMLNLNMLKLEEMSIYVKGRWPGENKAKNRRSKGTSEGDFGEVDWAGELWP